MKKKSIVLLLIGVVVLTFLVVTFVFTMNDYNQTLAFTPKETTKINYNNYATSNSVDYRNGRFAWSTGTVLGVTGTVVNSDGKVQKIHGAGEQIQLFDGGTVFLNQNTLTINKERKSRIAKNVDSFMAIGTGILYSQLSDSYEKTLYWYDAETETSKAVAQNVAAYCADEQKLLVLDNSGWVTLYSEATAEKKLQLEIQSYPIVMMLQNDCLLYRLSNRLCLWNPDTGTAKEILLSEGEYVNDRMSFICDKDRIVCSFQATRTDGSIVTDIDSPNNGVWSIDPLTLKKQKLCNETFEELYLFDDMLVGKNEKGIYQISLADGELTKIVQ